MLKYINETYECNVDLSVDGEAYIYAKNKQTLDDARMLVQDLVVDIKIGDVFSAEIRELRDFGALVRITRAQEALLHVSDLSHHIKITKKPINELLAIGQRIDVKVCSSNLLLSLFPALFGNYV